MPSPQSPADPGAFPSYADLAEGLQGRAYAELLKAEFSWIERLALRLMPKTSLALQSQARRDQIDKTAREQMALASPLVEFLSCLSANPSQCLALPPMPPRPSFACAMAWAACESLALRRRPSLLISPEACRQRARRLHEQNSGGDEARLAELLCRIEMLAAGSIERLPAYDIFDLADLIALLGNELNDAREAAGAPSFCACCLAQDESSGIASACPIPQGACGASARSL